MCCLEPGIGTYVDPFGRWWCALHEILVTIRPQVGEANVIQINQGIVVGLMVARTSSTLTPSVRTVSQSAPTGMNFPLIFGPSTVPPVTFMFSRKPSATGPITWGWSRHSDVRHHVFHLVLVSVCAHCSLLIVVY